MTAYTIPSQVEFALHRLYAHKYEAYIVGGAPRDLLLNQTPHDYDIATNATPDQIAVCFGDCKLLTLGRAYGTLTLIKDRIEIEITTYRTESNYADHRHPEVAFTRRIEEDLKRRDFTINAMAYRPPSFWVDPYGGAEDLKKKLLRCVGNPQQRFSEDPLRILRVFRFGSMLGFSLEKETMRAAKEQVPLLRHISKERIFYEFQLLICGKNAAQILNDGSFLWQEIWNENAPSTHLLELLSKAKPDPALRLGICWIKKTPLEAEETLRALNASHSFITKIKMLLDHKNSAVYRSETAFRKLYGSLQKEELEILLSFWKTLGEETAWFETQMQQIEQKNLCCRLKDLKINGDDLKKLGVPDGKEVGRTLAVLLELVLSGKLDNETQKLARYVRENHSRR